MTLQISKKNKINLPNDLIKLICLYIGPLHVDLFDMFNTGLRKTHLGIVELDEMVNADIRNWPYSVMINSKLYVPKSDAWTDEFNKSWSSTRYYPRYKYYYDIESRQFCCDSFNTRFLCYKCSQDVPYRFKDKYMRNHRSGYGPAICICEFAAATKYLNRKKDKWSEEQIKMFKVIFEPKYDLIRQELFHCNQLKIDTIGLAYWFLDNKRKLARDAFKRIRMVKELL